MPYRLLPQIGRTIASIGSNQFTISLHSLIMAKLSVDASHFQSFTRLPSANESAQPLDDVITSNRGELPPDDAARLYLQETTEHFRHCIVVVRKAPLFSDQEATQLDHLAPLLFSLLEQHLQSQRGHALSMSIEERFHERLRETGMKLSEREQQVCLGLLAGQTVPYQAEQLMLTPHTVGSYLRRATTKLGISGRNALMRWLYEAPEAVASIN